MTKTDKAEFASIIKATMNLYNREVTNEVLYLWWAALEHLQMVDVRSAIQAHIQGDGGHFPPLPADVIKACRNGSGHIPPDEAWSLALTSMQEEDSIIWTTQVSEAWGAAWPCMENGDKYGARLAFMSAYDRLIKQGPPVWRVSLGYSHAGRERAVDEALKRGLIAPDKAKELLPYDSAMVPSVSGLLPAPEQTPEQKANVAAMLAALKSKFEVPE